MLRYILLLSLLILAQGTHAFELRIAAKTLFAEQLPARPTITLPPVIHPLDTLGGAASRDGLSRSGCEIFNSFTLNKKRIATGDADSVRRERLTTLVNIATAYEVLMLNQGQLTHDQIRLSAMISEALLRVPPTQAEVMISQCSRAARIDISQLQEDSLNYFSEAINFFLFYSDWNN